ncbi:hypothetical protein BJ875DRAFT_494615 [Amylocarpus encephaloides]|uniref:Tat pathway signal sequence n=1 Tax=Amylocarpus encephaloides TaxID=45428 RepID=A0A9P8C749_9HELO|nr:hypothetical protein BJ875DRAFT_494615 [Amylocarpus encephaloides]
MRIKRPVSLSSSLPAISEDDSFVEPHHALATPIPSVPPRSAKRASNRNFVAVRPPRFNYQSPPPSYWEDDTSIEAGGNEKFSKFRRRVVNNEHVAKRGGWLRLGIIALVLILCILGLVVGLTIGLRNKKTHPNRNDNDYLESNQSFPLGHYSINTVLSSTATNCTSNPSTWLCYPYTTYSQNPSMSATVFDWIITTNISAPVNPSNPFLLISSTPNPFTTLFNNLTLSLRLANQADEHYYFSTNIPKLTKPTTQIGENNVAAACNFNNTVLTGLLYTRRQKSYPSANAISTEAGAYKSWPYAVEIEQVATSGSGTPSCVDPSGTSLGSFEVPEQGQQCECEYLNSGT